MSQSLRILIIAVICIYFVFIYHLLKKKRFELRYSLLWIFSGIIMLILSVFPGIVEWIASICGIEVASNGLFAGCIFLIIILLVAMTTAISKFAIQIKTLTQQIGLLEKRIRDLENE